MSLKSLLSAIGSQSMASTDMTLSMGAFDKDRRVLGAGDGSLDGASIYLTQRQVKTPDAGLIRTSAYCVMEIREYRRQMREPGQIRLTHSDGFELGE